MKQDLFTIFKNFNLALDAGNCPLANSFLDQAYPILLNYPDKHIFWAGYFLNLATIKNNSGKFDESLVYCQKGERIISINKDTALKAQLEGLKAAIYENIGDSDKSLEHAQESLKLFYKLKDNGKAVSVLITIGNNLLRKGYWHQAILNYSEALFISKKITDRRLEAKALMALGYVFRGHRFLYLAIDHYREAELIFKEIDFKQGLVTAMYERANTYLSLMMPDATKRLMNEIEVLVPENSTMRTFLLKLKCCVHNQNENATEAFICANQLLDFYKNAGDKRGEAESYERLGSCHYNLMEMDKAKDSGEKALKIAEEIGDRILQTQSKVLLQNIEEFTSNKINQVQPL